MFNLLLKNREKGSAKLRFPALLLVAMSLPVGTLGQADRAPLPLPTLPPELAKVKLNPPHTEPLPPKWIFGYIQSQWGVDSFGYGDQKSFLDHARALRGIDNQYGKHLHPADGIVLDMYWNGKNWDWPKNIIWDKSRFPNPKQMIDELHAMHYHLIMNHHAGGFGPEWLAHLRTDLEHGLDVPWLDFWDEGSARETQVWKLMREVRGKNQRLVFMARHYARPNAQNTEPQTETSDGVGKFKAPDEDEIEKTMPIHWTGDNIGNWAGLDEAILGVVDSVDGAAGGWSYLHTDTPGHRDGMDPELAARWIQFSDFTTTTRNHGWFPRDVWSWGPKVEKDSVQSRMLRYRLLPYIYRYAWEIWEKAIPLTRPMTLAYPAEREDLKYQFMFGDSLLVAPVYRPAAEFPDGRMSIYLPKGSDWINYWDQSVSAGGQSITVDVKDFSRIPLYVKRGAIIPLGPKIYWIDPAVHPDPLTLDIYPLSQGESSTLLYDDDGETLGYQRGQYATTKASATNSSCALAVHIGASVGHYHGEPSMQTYMLKINLADPGYTKVTNGSVVFKKLKNHRALVDATAPQNAWALDTAHHILYIRFQTSTRVENNIIVQRSIGTEKAGACK